MTTTTKTALVVWGHGRSDVRDVREADGEDGSPLRRGYDLEDDVLIASWQEAMEESSYPDGWIVYLDAERGTDDLDRDPATRGYVVTSIR